MRIALLSDVYKPIINGVVNHVALLKQHLETWGEQVWLFVPGSSSAPDEPNVVRIPGIPIADTGYHLSISLDQRSRELLQSMDVIHVHHPFISGSIGLLAANRYNIPLIFTSHTRYDLYVKQYLPLLPAALSDSALHAYFQLFSQRCAAMIAPSQGIAEMMKGWGLQARIEVIPNGIDLDLFTQPTHSITRQQLGIPAEAIIAIYVGRMSQEKSIERLLTLYKQVAHEETQSHLLLVGGGPNFEEYRELAGTLGLLGSQTESQPARVTFTGSVPYEHMPDYLALSNFFITTSVSEVHPLTLIEAATAGLPALGIRSPGVGDVVQSEVTGLLAEDNDLSVGLGFLRLTKNAVLRQQLGEAARTYSRQLSAHTNARRILNLYREVKIRE